MVRSLYDQFEESSWLERHKGIFALLKITPYVIVQLLTLCALMFSNFKDLRNIFAYFVGQTLLNVGFGIVGFLSYIRSTRGDGGQFTIPPLFIGAVCILWQIYGTIGLVVSPSTSTDPEISHSFVLFVAACSVFIYTIIGGYLFYNSIKLRWYGPESVDRRMYSLAATQDFELDDIENGFGGLGASISDIDQFPIESDHGSKSNKYMASISSDNMSFRDSMQKNAHSTIQSSTPTKATALISSKVDESKYSKSSPQSHQTIEQRNIDYNGNKPNRFDQVESNHFSKTSDDAASHKDNPEEDFEVDPEQFNYNTLDIEKELSGLGIE